MTPAVDTDTAAAAAVESAARARNRAPLLVAGVVICAFMAFVAVFGPLLAPYDPHALSGGAVAHPSADHLLGTNDVGQDIFSELVLGTRASLSVAVPAAALALLVGAFVGIGAGLRGGTASLVAMRIVDAFLALPGLPLVILLSALTGGSPTAVVLVIALAGWPPIARVLNAQSLELRNRGFVRAARGFGTPPRYIIRRHLLPAVGPTAAAAFVQWAATAVAVESGLALLGLGDPARVSWGGMLNRALDYQGLYYGTLWVWWVLPAGLAITLAALGFTFVGVGLEPMFNPQWRRAL